MSLHPSPIRIPARTRKTALAVFKKPSLAMQVADLFGRDVFRDEQFADLFADRGQGALSPARLGLVTLMQYAEGLTDRAAADAARARIDWKYLLGLELEDDGFDHTALTKFRARLLEDGAERRLFDAVLAACLGRGLVKAGGRQRTDSTHVLAAVRRLNRLELVTEAMRAALNALSVVAPGWVRDRVDPAWADRYGARAENFRFPKAAGERERLLERTGADGHALLGAIWEAGGPEVLRQIPAVEVLRRIWVEQYEAEGGRVRPRDGGDQPASGRRINSPYDPDARYATKRETTWIGYKADLTETCDPEGPRLITHVETAEAPGQDADTLERVQAGLEAAGLLPGRQLVDAGYTPAGRLLGSRERYGVELVGPPRADVSWQAKAGAGYEAGRFEVDWEREEATCPRGERSVTWKPGLSERGKAVIRVAFSREACGGCEALGACTASKEKRRRLTLRPRAEAEALAEARAREGGEAYRREYDLRAGVESTISQAVRRFGLRAARYRGEGKVRLQHLLTAAAMNVVRVVDWVNGDQTAGARAGAFARLMAPRAA